MEMLLLQSDPQPFIGAALRLAVEMHAYVSSDDDQSRDAARKSLSNAIIGFERSCLHPQADGNAPGNGKKKTERKFDDDLRTFAGWSRELLSTPPEKLTQNSRLLNRIRAIATELLLKRLPLSATGGGEHTEDGVRESLTAISLLILSTVSALACRKDNAAGQSAEPALPVPSPQVSEPVVTTPDRSGEQVRNDCVSPETANEIVSLIDQGLLIFDETDHLVYANPRAYELLDLTPSVLSIGSPRQKFVEYCAQRGDYGEDKKHSVEEVLDSFRPSGMKSVERVTPTTGSVQRVLVQPLSGGGSFSTYTDITELKRRQSQIDNHTKALDVILNNSKHGMSWVDENLVIRATNAEFCRLLDFPEEVCRAGCKLEDVFRFNARRGEYGPGDVEQQVSERIELASRFEPHCFERVRGDGMILRVEGHPVPEGGFVTFYTDVTEERRREQELNDQKNQLEIILKTTKHGFVWCDADLIVRGFNPKFAEIALLKPDEAQIGRTLEEFMRLSASRGLYGDVDVDEMIANRKRTLETPGPQFAEVRRKDGRVIVIESQPVESGGFVSCFTDVTDDRRREAELENARQEAVIALQAKSDFLANMSHEIRTPMNGVIGMAEILSRTTLDERQHQCVNTIMSSGTALITIINDILDFSKFEAGKIELDPVSFDLRSAIEDVATLMSSRAEDKKLELITHFQTDLPEWVVGDAGRIRQIVTNLVGNAIKFTEEGHVLIEIAGAVENDLANLKVSVTDTGIGIPPEKRRHIFEKFEQVDNSSTRRYGGTGLGLAISKKLVELMGGEIGIDSTLGEGSTFWFTLKVPVDQENRNRTPSRPASLEDVKVLLVDDIPLNLEILKEQVECWGMRPVCAPSGPRALAALHEAKQSGDPFRLAILDFHMPDMDGDELARAIKADPVIADVTLVILTSVGQKGDARKFRYIGVEGYLIKPTRAAHLLETITSLSALSVPDHLDNAPEAAKADPVAARPGTSAAVEDDSPEHEAEIRPAIDDLDEELFDPVPEGTTEQTTGHATGGASVEDASRNGAGPSTATGQKDLVAPDLYRVLVAEDNEVNQLVVEQMLEGSPVSLTIAKNGKEAVSHFELGGADIILMDVSMPEMDGFEATSAIRDLEQKNSLERTPIVGLTAHVMENDRKRCMAAGMDDFLPKPIAIDDLRDMLEKWLEQSASSGETRPVRLSA